MRGVAMAAKKSLYGPVVLDKDKETKGSYRYAEGGGDDSWGINIYLRKADLNGDVPESIEVTLKVVS
jgi:hypothetical protein